jgi:hypothetical protein
MDAMTLYCLMCFCGSPDVIGEIREVTIKFGHGRPASLSLRHRIAGNEASCRLPDH